MSDDRERFGSDAHGRQRGGWRTRVGEGRALLAVALLVLGLIGLPLRARSAEPCRKSSSLPAGDLVGTARVVDGDTLCLAGRRVRLKGIDAPELGTRPGQASRLSLTDRVRGRVVRCRPQELDRYDRVVAWCSIPRAGRSSDLGRWQIQQGQARRWARYDEGRYRGLENPLRAR